ncbi:MAG TPA: hypothetical protein VFS51_12425, partial [Gemmatimonadales bacterium]|nr:hypothetical protein [Gemmatimonadales bacterium]
GVHSIAAVAVTGTGNKTYNTYLELFRGKTAAASRPTGRPAAVSALPSDRSTLTLRRVQVDAP